MAAYASKLPEPYARILTILAPTISVLVARYGPSILDIGATLVGHVVVWAKHRATISKLRMFLGNRRKAL